MALHRKIGRAEIAHRRERRQRRRHTKPRRKPSNWPIFMSDDSGGRRGLKLMGIVGAGPAGPSLGLEHRYSWTRKRVRRSRQQAAEAAKRG